VNISLKTQNIIEFLLLYADFKTLILYFFFRDKGQSAQRSDEFGRWFAEFDARQEVVSHAGVFTLTELCAKLAVSFLVLTLLNSV